MTERNVIIAVAIYLAAISLVGFILPIIDKSRAKKGRWRISEKALFITGLLGGAVSEYISMLIFRHKTKHKRFMIGLPCIIALQIAAIILIFLLTKK